MAVEIRPGARFEEIALDLFGLAQDGQTDPKGIPGLFRAAIFAREFTDVSYFAKPHFRCRECSSVPWRL